MLGQLICSKSEKDTGQNGFYDPNISNLVKEVSCKVRLNFFDSRSHAHSLQSPVLYNEGAERLRIIAVDLGIKNNQIRCLADRGVCVKVVPWNYNFNNEGLQCIME